MKVEDFIGPKVMYLESGQCIFSVEDNDEEQLIADVRGWGAIQNLFKNKDGSIDFEKAGAFQDELGYWLADAINKKLEETRK